MFRILLARQGQTMENGTLVRWCKPEGQGFDIGEDLYEIETEKTIVPIQATRPGRLVRTLAQAGDTLPVGELLALAADPGEAATPAQIDAMVQGAPEYELSAGPSPASVASDTRPAPRTLIAAPKARALAMQMGIDLSTVSGSGADGAITADDVRHAAQAKIQGDGAPADPPPAIMGVPAGSVEAERTADSRITRTSPLSPIARSAIAALDKGAQVPQFTQGVLIDATALVERKRFAGDSLAYMDLFLDAIVRAAREVPEVLAQVSDREMHYFDAIDISIATDTDQGLLLAVLHDVAAMTTAARNAAWRSLVKRARLGKLLPGETTGGILALSNLGARGVDYGTPLLPAGHAAIVFFGSLEPRAMVVGDRIEARPTIHLGISYDHRAVDGVLGARFTSALRKALEAPVPPTGS
jgi:pyruvate dehydrogenase E2 component (dihydrolipoamide acetyltransferase)